MKHEIYSYRFSKQIIEHPNYQNALEEITSIIQNCPLFIYPNKSSKNNRLDVVQQLFNTFFDRKFVCDFGWLYHPNATRIENSGLTADYRKDFNGLRIQAEAQFGNMSRWYSDIFKFQTAYSQDLIDMGLCIIPMNSLARRIDSNITNFERCIREIPSAKLSITLPILLIGIDIDENTRIVDVASSHFSNINQITGKGRSLNRYRIVNAYILNQPINEIDENSEVGSIAASSDSSDDE